MGKTDSIIGTALLSVGVSGLIGYVLVSRYFSLKYKDYFRDVSDGDRQVESRVVFDNVHIFDPYLEVIVSKTGEETKRFVDKRDDNGYFGSLDYLEVLRDDGEVKFCFGGNDIKKCPNGLLNEDKKEYLDLFDNLGLRF
jgi:hypothetical protein